MKYKVEILPKNEDFIEELIVFLSEKSFQFRRDFYIDNILNKKTSLNKFDYLRKISPISLENVWGSSFQSSYRSNNDIYAISHEINSIEIIDEKIFGNLNPSDYGDVIDFDKGKLRPVYFKKDHISNYQIATFDIDFNITCDDKK